jgi:hypothetical protein
VVISIGGLRLARDERTLSIATFRGQTGREVGGAICPVFAAGFVSRCRGWMGRVWGRWGMSCFMRKLGCEGVVFVWRGPKRSAGQRDDLISGVKANKPQHNQKMGEATRPVYIQWHIFIF